MRFYFLDINLIYLENECFYKTCTLSFLSLILQDLNLKEKFPQNISKKLKIIIIILIYSYIKHLVQTFNCFLFVTKEYASNKIQNINLKYLKCI